MNANEPRPQQLTNSRERRICRYPSPNTRSVAAIFSDPTNDYCILSDPANDCYKRTACGYAPVIFDYDNKLGKHQDNVIISE